jgi:hypothetical protein
MAAVGEHRAQHCVQIGPLGLEVQNPASDDRLPLLKQAKRSVG